MSLIVQFSFCEVDFVSPFVFENLGWFKGRANM